MACYDNHLTQQISRSSLKRPLQDHENPADQKRPCISRRPRAAYKRYPKPPYTYLGMTVVAIHNSPSKRLTLLGIHNTLAEMFTFFQGEYRGWRDSVRHILSLQKCFIRIPRKDDKGSKYSFWTVDLSMVPVTAFKRTSKTNADQWAPNLFLQLGIPEITLPHEPEEKQQQATQQTQQQPFLPRPSFNIESILRSTDVSVGEPSDTKYDHPYSFLAYQNTSHLTDAHNYQPSYYHYPPSFHSMVYQAVNSPYQIHLEDSLRPEPRYGEAGPISSLTSHHMLPDYTYNHAATDLSLPSRAEPALSLSSDNRNLTRNTLHDDAKQTTGGHSTNQIQSHSWTSQHQAVTQPRTASHFYRPFEDDGSSSFQHFRPPPSLSTISSASSSSPTYSIDTSSVISQSESNSLMYIPSSFSAPVSSDACMETPRLSTSQPFTWNHYLSDTSSSDISTSASLAAAVDDLAMFSDDSSSRFVPYIPIPVFSDDTQSQSTTQPE